MRRELYSEKELEEWLKNNPPKEKLPIPKEKNLEETLNDLLKFKERDGKISNPEKWEKLKALDGVIS